MGRSRIFLMDVHKMTSVPFLGFIMPAARADEVPNGALFY
jgi:hypothetical protein